MKHTLVTFRISHPADNVTDIEMLQTYLKMLEVLKASQTFRMPQDLCIDPDIKIELWNTNQESQSCG